MRLLDAAMVDEFCREGAKAQTSRSAWSSAGRCCAGFPQTQRTWLKFRGGAYTGANLFALGSPEVLPAIEQWRAVEQDRKKGWRRARCSGRRCCSARAAAAVSLDQSVAQLGRKLGLRSEAVELSNPLAGVDVDKPEDHALVEAILAGRA